MRRLTGWGRTNASVAELVEVGPGDVADVAKSAGPRGALMRGLGRSYGDAAQNAGGIVMRLMGTANDAVVDTEARTVTVSAGVSLDDLMRVLVPRGWFVPVTPGTRYVTVGGAIASDIHGKNHHSEGSFGNHVHSITMLLADGSTVVVGPSQQPELFWATVGGMGLTGAILEATFSILPIETSLISVDTNRANDLDELLSLMSEGDHRYRYSVAWIDLVAKGNRLGRSVLTRGDHAPAAALDAKHANTPLAFNPRQVATVPPIIPSRGLLNHLTVAAFNELWYRKAPAVRTDELQSIASFFHPLDMIGEWSRCYGAKGMVQYQFVVPFGEEAAMRTVIERLSASGSASFLAVLKRFGDGNPAPLSFPAPGWTLALDVPAASKGLGDLLHGLDRVVLAAGGRHYFAKDAHTTPDAIRAGYPRLDEWKHIRNSVDPHGCWQSDLSRRLGLTD